MSVSSTEKIFELVPGEVWDGAKTEVVLASDYLELERRIHNKGLPIGWRMVPLAVNQIPHACWDAASKAFQENNGKHGFYESCAAAYHAFLDKFEEIEE